MNERERMLYRAEPWRISRALLENIFHPVTAVVSLDADGRVLAAELFDTFDYGACVREAPDCEQVWLMSQHPEGRTALYDEDRRRAAQLRARLRGKDVRVFITGEDLGCVEIGWENVKAAEKPERKAGA